jgi:hypothetical protein
MLEWFDESIGSPLALENSSALVSPLALIPNYREEYPWLFERIKQIQQICKEPLPQDF